MAKNTRTRHSTTRREPVTIDLEADAVKREEDDVRAEAGEVQPGGQGEAEQEQNDQTDRSGEGTETEPTSSSSEDVDEAGTEASSIPADDQPTERPASRGGAGGALLAGIVGGVVVLGAIAALQWADLLPISGSGGNAAIAELRRDLEGMQSQVSQLSETRQAGVSREELEQAVAGPVQDVAELRETVAALQEAVSSGGAGEASGLQALNDRLSELEAQIAELPQTGEQATDGGAAERVAGLEGAVEEVRQALGQVQDQASTNSSRLEDLTGQLGQLSEQVASQDQGQELAQMVAASALRSAVERGEPFASELETYASVASDPSVLEPLRQYAETGIPTREELAVRAPEIASRIAATESATPPDAGLIDRLMSSARSVVTVRPVGEVEGEGVGAIAARMEAAVINGDYQRALAEYESLPPAAQEAAREFADGLRARQAADQSLEEALSSALDPA